MCFIGGCARAIGPRHLFGKRSDDLEGFARSVDAIGARLRRTRKLRKAKVDQRPLLRPKGHGGTFSAVRSEAGEESDQTRQWSGTDTRNEANSRAASMDHAEVTSLSLSFMFKLRFVRLHFCNRVHVGSIKGRRD